MFPLKVIRPIFAKILDLLIGKSELLLVNGVAILKKFEFLLNLLVLPLVVVYMLLVVGLARVSQSVCEQVLHPIDFSVHSAELLLDLLLKRVKVVLLLPGVLLHLPVNFLDEDH